MAQNSDRVGLADAAIAQRFQVGAAQFVEVDILEVRQALAGVGDHLRGDIDAGPVVAAGRQFPTDAANAAAKFQDAVTVVEIDGGCDLPRGIAAGGLDDFLAGAAVHRGQGRFRRGRLVVPKLLVRLEFHTRGYSGSGKCLAAPAASAHILRVLPGKVQLGGMAPPGGDAVAPLAPERGGTRELSVLTDRRPSRPRRRCRPRCAGWRARAVCAPACRAAGTCDVCR